MLLYACTIFVSAFLLFQVQPMIAKIILPWFGGTAAVWTTCMLFFQLALLGGYLYSHFTTSRLASKAQTTLHMVLLAGSLLLLPVLPGESWKPSGEENPTLRILALLAATVGFPYFLLSTTGPLVQAWFARAFPGKSPYRLFALSNAGSMIALLSYPFVVEPVLPARLQAYVWSGSYVLFAALCATLAVRSRGLATAPLEEVIDEVPATAPPITHWVLWTLLAACASALLLAITNHLTLDVAPIPLLWVLPLSLYLLSFILTFDSTGWYRRAWYLPMTALALGGMAYMLRADIGTSVARDVAIFVAALFICCMSCHGELTAIKPHPHYLTGFYLMISLGGALGGLFVGVVAPYTFPDYWELPILLVACAVLLLAVNYADPESMFHRTERGWGWVVGAVATLALGVTMGQMIQEDTRSYRVVARNFYGGLRTADYGEKGEIDWSRKLTHGVINHGEQYLEPARNREATSYFGPNSGVGRAIRSKDRDKPQKIGITGLGAGVMLTYSRPGDHYRIYEINPLVVDVAKREFTFIKDCPAKLDIVMGDARLSLEREAPQNYDVLHMDAFSSDSVPVHLLTKEAFAQYFRHLKPDGILVLHISNRYLNLQPVVARGAEALGKTTMLVEDEGDDDLGYFGTDMVLVANQPEHLQKKEIGQFPAPKLDPKVALWTDDFSNLFQIIK